MTIQAQVEALSAALAHVRDASRAFASSSSSSSSFASSSSPSSSALLLVDVKSASRAAHLAAESGRQRVQAASAAADASHLALQNLLYERAHLQRLIRRCREYPSPELDRVALAPPEETLRAAAGASAAAPWARQLIAAYPQLHAAASAAAAAAAADAAPAPAASSSSTPASSTSSSTSSSSASASTAALQQLRALVASTLAPAGPADAHDLVIARLAHEGEQRRALEAQLEATKAP